MPLVLATLSILGPLTLACIALLPARWADRHPWGLGVASLAASVFALIAALAVAAGVAMNGPVNHAFLSYGPASDGFALGVKLDALSLTMLVLVAFIGVVIVSYSRNYLAGDGRQGHFFAWLCATLAPVMMLMIAGNLLLMAAAWIATSVTLHRLLLFYAERPAARRAALKKAIVSRIGDLCLLGAIAAALAAFGSVDLAVMAEKAAHMRASGIVPGAATVAAVLIVTAALLKSAQFPVHSWLPMVIDTPTPVSALLHAGIVNAGGILVLRTADLLVLSPGALHLLAIAGGLTALIGAAVMITQTSIKLSLAWSTIAQMGFMLLQCGLGSFTMAALHIVAHSLYKAHAFLSAGSAVEDARQWRVQPFGPQPPLGLTCGLAAMGVILGFAGTALAGTDPTTAPGVVLFASLLFMGLTPFLATALVSARSHPGLAVQALLLASSVAIAFFILQNASVWLLGPSLPVPPPVDALTWLAALLVLTGFGGLVWLQAALRAGQPSPGLERLYVALVHGLYVDAFIDRLSGRNRPAHARTKGSLT